MSQTQRICRVPTDAYQNDVDWEAHPFGSQHLVSTLLCQNAQHSRAGGLTASATEPGDLPQMVRNRKFSEGIAMRRIGVGGALDFGDDFLKS